MRTLLLAITMAISASQMAATPTDCGPVRFSYDEKSWKLQEGDLEKEGQLTMRTLNAVGDRGTTFICMGFALKGKEAQMFKTMAPPEMLATMSSQFNQGNKPPSFKKVQKEGDFHYAAWIAESPSGKKAHTIMAVTRKESNVVYFIHSFEPHRLDKPKAYDKKVALAQMLKFLRATKFK